VQTQLIFRRPISSPLSIEMVVEGNRAPAGKYTIPLSTESELFAVRLWRVYFFTFGEMDHG